MKSIVILASGKGSNAQRIIEYFSGSNVIRVLGIISDRKASGALEVARTNGIKAYYIPQQAILSGELTTSIQNIDPDLVVLAGFLRMVPSDLIALFPDRIINIHPSLLPKHGGAGMYGARVHESVISNGDMESGVTVHYVNEEYDKGRMIAQIHCQVSSSDTPSSLAARIHTLEHRFYPFIIESILTL